MAELVSMKRTASEMKSDSTCEAPCDVSRDPYPYGLEIRLEKESMSKLGSQVESLTVGATVKVNCVGWVTFLVSALFPVKNAIGTEMNHPCIC